MSYTVFDTELKVVSSLNATALGFFSGGAFVLGVAISIWLAWAYADATVRTPTMDHLTLVGVILFVAIAIALYVAGGIAVTQRQNLITTIKNESKDPA